MAATRIFRWADAPLPWRLMLAHRTGDPTPRTHLAVVPPKHREQWAQTPPVDWTELLRTVLEDEDGLSGIKPGDELIAGNEQPPRVRTAS